MNQKKARTLLVTMPFHDIHQPNISLGVLKSVITQSGHNCDVCYVNLDFADTIGRDLYNFFQKNMPLIGDYLFSEILHKRNTENITNESYQSLSDEEKKAFGKARMHIHEFIDKKADEIVRKQYDIIGFSLIFQTVPSLALAKRIKEIAPETKIICGGPNCVGEMGLALHQNFEWIDYVCRGDGENLVVELLNNLIGFELKLEEIKGLIWRKNGISIANGKRTNRILDLDKLPTPDYSDWWKRVQELDLYYQSKDWAIPFESSRGCWYGDAKHCVFCGLGGEELISRVKSPDKVIDEIKEFTEKYPIKNFSAIDLIFPNRFFNDFVPKLSKEKFDVMFNYEIKANISKKQLYDFRSAGILNLQPGIESLSSKVLKQMRKGLKSYVNIRLLKWSFGMGMNAIWNFVYGIPGEDKEEYSRMAELIPELVHLQPPVFGCVPISLVRNSPMFEERESFGIINVTPRKIYSEIYDLPAEQIEKIAYYFEFDTIGQPDLNYAEPLIEAVEYWYGQIGEAQLFSLEVGDRIYFHDTREVARAERLFLEGFEKVVYDACDIGRSIKVLCDTLKCTTEEVETVLDKLTHYKLVLHVDGKYLSIAVSMDEIVASKDDIEAAISICSYVYRMWMKSRCDPYFTLGKKLLEAFS